MSEPVITSCAQCVGRDCASAPCHLGCEYGNGWCQTVVSGFMAGEIGNLMDDDTKPLPLFTGVMGLPLRTVRPDLAALGAQVGDILTHINNEYIGGDINRLAELSPALKKGDSLILWRNGKRVDVEL